MGMGVTIENKYVLKKIQDVKDKLKAREGINRKALVLLDRWVQKNFQTQGKLAMGEGWKTLSPVTIMSRQEKHHSKSTNWKILIDTGTMRSRWKMFADAEIASLESGVDYAIKHHKGWEVPERRILPTIPQAWEAVGPLYQDWNRSIVES